MKKNLFVIVAMVVMMVVAGCKKEEKSDPAGPTPVEDALTPFIGTFDLTIVTDSLQQDGSWIANSALPEVARIPERSGRLTITRGTTDGVVNVLGRVDIAGDSVDYYNTTATVDKQGRLQIAAGPGFVSPVKGTFTFTFQPFAAAQTMSFKVDGAYEFNQSQYVERATNSIVRRK